MPEKSILLLLCTFLVLSIGLSTTGYAGKPEKDNGKGKPDKSGTTCEINFCIDFADGHELANDNLANDNNDGYCHGTDKVLVFTGKGPGFGFDTTQSGKGKTMTRFLFMDLTDFGVGKVDGVGEPKENVVFKFDKSGDPSGLDLCSLKSNGAPGEVGLAISYEVDGATDNSNTLTYGAPADAACGKKVTVTRTAADTWTIAGTTACLWDGQKDALVFNGSRNRDIIGPEDQDVSFIATITEIQ